MKWFDKALCRNRRACADCRTKEEFRESLHRAGLVDSPDFACPSGFTSHDLPEPVAAKQRERRAKRCCGSS